MLELAELDKILAPDSSDDEILAALQNLEIQNLNKDVLAHSLHRLRGAASLSEDLALELHELGPSSIDCSGTGGSGLSHFNTSTCVAFVLAAAGCKVAKFGGRAASGNSGSFDFLEGLGISSALPPQDIADALSVCGLAFIFAPEIYPVLKRLVPLRKRHGKPTLFNYIGPLLNPVHPANRLMGISSDPARKLIGEELASDEKTNSALLVTAGGILDELDVNGPSKLTYVDGQLVQEFELDPEALSLLERNAQSGKICSFDTPTNVKIFKDIIEGHDSKSDCYKMILLNSAAALFVLKACRSISEGLAIAADLISNGELAESVETCRRFYGQLS